MRLKSETLVNTYEVSAPAIQPSIDSQEIRWALESLQVMVQQLPMDSMIGSILRQTQHELKSLVANMPRLKTVTGADVIGPVRVKVAA